MYQMTDQDKERLENSFTYHPPKPDQIPRYEALRNKARELAIEFMEIVPPSREKSLAITKLEEAVMWANKGIACNE